MHQLYISVIILIKRKCCFLDLFVHEFQVKAYFILYKKFFSFPIEKKKKKSQKDEAQVNNVIKM